MWYNDYNTWIDPKTIKKSKLAKYENDVVFQNTFNSLLGDALSRYELEGAPDTISRRTVMQALLWNATVFFFEKGNSLFALPGMPDGSGINVNGDFAGAYVYGQNGFNEKINLIIPGADDSDLLLKTSSGVSYKDGTGVMIRENDQMFPFLNILIKYSFWIADTMRTLDVCRQNAKRPYIISAEQSVVESIKKYFEHRDNNEDYIISTGIFPADKVHIEPLQNNPDFTHSASELIDWYTQRFREECGIKNLGAQVDKKGENLQTAEITYNDEYTQGKIKQCLQCLNEGMDLVNKSFGTSMRFVERRAFKETKEEKQEENIAKEDNDDRISNIK